MFTKQLFINVLVFAFIGGFLKHLEVTFMMWEFYVILGGMAIIQINNSINH